MTVRELDREKDPCKDCIELGRETEPGNDCEELGRETDPSNDRVYRVGP